MKFIRKNGRIIPIREDSSLGQRAKTSAGMVASGATIGAAYHATKGAVAGLSEGHRDGKALINTMKGVAKDFNITGHAFTESMKMGKKVMKDAMFSNAKRLAKSGAIKGLKIGLTVGAVLGAYNLATGAYTSKRKPK